MSECIKCGAAARFGYYKSIFDREGVQACGRCDDEVSEYASMLFGWRGYYFDDSRFTKRELDEISLRDFARRREMAERKFAEWTRSLTV